MIIKISDTELINLDRIFNIYCLDQIIYFYFKPNTKDNLEYSIKMPDNVIIPEADLETTLMKLIFTAIQSNKNFLDISEWIDE